MASDPALVAGVRDVDRVLREDRRVVVRECDTAATEFVGHPGDVVGRRLVGERVDLARLRDVPVLAELAREVAAGGAERQHAEPGRKWLSGFFSIGSTQNPLDRP